MLGRECQADRYKLSGLNIRTFWNEKFLSVGKDGFSITEIDDSGEVNSAKYKLHNTIIQGVESLEYFYSCYSFTVTVTTVSIFYPVLEDIAPGEITKSILAIF